MEKIDTKTIMKGLEKKDYTAPAWCRMHPLEHADGMGGCWGISYGLVKEQGENYCVGCEYHRDQGMDQSSKF